MSVTQNTRTFSVTSTDSNYIPGVDDFQLTITSVTSCKSLQTYLARQTALRLARSLKEDNTPNTTVNTGVCSLSRGSDYNSYAYEDSMSTGSVYTVIGERGREEWSTKAEFILSCLGYSIGLGNIWRFPYICYKGGGGAFLIPYFIMMFVCGIPILFMELAIGQYFKLGPIGAIGHICPLLKGAGFASVIVAFMLTTYYNVLICWTMYYLFNSFRYVLPWSNCDNVWNSKFCWSYKGNSSTNANYSSIYANVSSHNETINDERTTASPTSLDLRTPSEEFYTERLLEATSGIEDMGGIRPELLALFLLSWILVYFCLWKSIRSSGKVVYFTVVFPFILLIAFLIHGVTLPGANIGLWFFFHPRWELLLRAKIWVLAASQAYSSLGIAYGCMTVMASYNKFNTSILPDTIIISLVNTLFSLLAGIAVFSTLGHIAFKEGKDIENIIDKGLGLVFIAVPEAISNMPVPQVWAIFFFLLLLLLGLDSQFALVEVIITSITDSYQHLIKKYLKSHEVFVFVICLVAFLCGLPHVTKGGVYFLNLVDHYAAAISINYIAFFEVIAVTWFYGVDRLVENIYEMTGKHTSRYFTICWWVASPALIMAIAIFSLIDYKTVTYDEDHAYPLWAEGLGWAIALSSVIVIPIVAFTVFWRSEGNTLMKKLKNSIKYNPYHQDKMVHMHDMNVNHNEVAKTDETDITERVTAM